MADPKAFFEDQFPKKFWPQVPTLLKTAYMAVEDQYETNPLFQVTSAKINKGRVVSWAVDRMFERAIQNGSLPFDCRWQDFARPMGKYLEILLSHSTASISQVARPDRQPRNVVFRENARVRAQGVFPLPEFSDEFEISGLPHLLLIHGHQNLDFAHFGVPSPTSRVDYAWRSDNLMKLPHLIPAEEDHPTEDTDYNLDDLNLLKEDIDRWRRDNGEQD